jgi:hypothetical protein
MARGVGSALNMSLLQSQYIIGTSCLASGALIGYCATLHRDNELNFVAWSHG